MEELKFNKYQTQLSPEIVTQYPKEVIDELFEYINAVPFIQRLISADRKYAKDLPRDAENKIIIQDFFKNTVLAAKIQPISN